MGARKKPASLSLDSTLRVKRDIVSRSVQGDEVVLDLESGTYFSLNPTGTFVWERLKKGAALADISRDLSGEFDVTPDKAARDILKLAESLAARGLVETV